MQTVIETDEQLRAAVGHSFGPSDWLEVTQEMIDKFAEATGDFQWIHVDVERCRNEAPGGVTIAHGFLTLSLVAVLQPQVLTVKAEKLLNYGIDRLRFLNAVPVGSFIRLSQIVSSVEAGATGTKVTSALTIEIKGQDKPALLADHIFLKIG